MGKSIYGLNGEHIGELSNDIYYGLSGEPEAYLSNGRIYRFGSCESICEIFSDGRVYAGSELIGRQEGDNFYMGSDFVASMDDCEPGESAWFGQTLTKKSSSSGWLIGLLELIGTLIRHGWPFALGSAVLAGIGIGVYWLIGKVHIILPFTDWLWIGLAVLSAVLLAASFFSSKRGITGFLTKAGMTSLFLSLTIICMLKLGLIACWAFPLDFLAKELCREGCLSAMENCPAALAIYRWFIGFTAKDGTIILSDGVKGLLDSADVLIKLSTEKLPFLIALIAIPLLILGGFLSVVFSVLIFPFICLAIPLVIPFLVCRLVAHLLYSLRG